MKIIDLEQGTPAWLRWRNTKITATSASILMDMNPFKTLNELYEEILGIIIHAPLNEKMKRGQELEPIARELFIKETGVHVTPLCGEHEKDWWMAASFDGVSQDHKIVCEIKCPKLKSHEEAIEKTIPPYYFAQCQHQLFVSGAEKVIYTSYYPKHLQEIAFVEILPDYDFIETLRRKAKSFYEDNLCQMTPPKEAWKLSIH